MPSMFPSQFAENHRISGPIHRVPGCLLVAFLLVSTITFAKDLTKSLPPHYRDWLTKDVVYIITNQERDAFLQLTSDEARDRFIEKFWDVRNPTPGSPDNAYKNEHYRRIEYANTYFGHVSHTEGWRTPMGQVYITLGEPSQRQKLLGLQKITPMEIWFYSNSSPALPPFFYVVFYQRDPMDEFRLYSPYSDGPEKLITAMVGPGRGDALKILTQDAGADVARVTISLLPDEPVDLQNPTVSLQSDLLLSTIKNLANNPISLEELANRRHLLEDVTHRVVLGEEYLDVTTVVLRDRAGNENLHYVLRLKKPEDFAVGQGDKGYFYSLLASAKVSMAGGKLIFSQEKKISHPLTDEQLDQVKGKVLGYEGWLPLPPGKYKVEFQLTNLIGNTAFRRETDVQIPDLPKPGTLAVSQLVPFSDASMVNPQAVAVQPFTGGGVKFLPLAGQELLLTQGQPLKFFYQLWVPTPGDASSLRKKVQVEYVYGRLSGEENKTIHDELSLDQLDRGGSIINGKQIPTGDLAPGHYRLVATLHDVETGAKTYGALNFSVSETTSAPAAWDVTDDKVAEDIQAGTIDYQRASCYIAEGDKKEAAQWLESALAKNESEERYRSRLVELYFEQQNYVRIIELYAKSGLNGSTDEQTIVRIAESFEKTGDVHKAIGVMESGARLNPQSGPLLLGLADYYRKAGDVQKAAAAEQKGRQLIAAHPQS